MNHKKNVDLPQLVGENLKDLERYGMNWKVKNQAFDNITFLSLRLRKTHHHYLNKI